MRKHSRTYVYGDGRDVYRGGLRAAWIVVHDPMAGRKSVCVYTVYRISLVGDKAAQVIGRELPLPTARGVVRRDMEALR